MPRVVKTKKARRRHLVEALRSGEFQQGNGQLERTASDATPKHCCLGVACRVAMRDGLDLEVDESRLNTRFDEQQYYAPSSIVEWYGFRSNHGGRVGCGAATDLAHLNDSGLSFAEIADVIEAELAGLFVD